MYMDGAAGLARNNMRAAQWLALAADKGHHPAQALLGHLLFVGEGVPRQRARGLMWLTLAKTAAQGPKDEWVRDLYGKDWEAASDDDRQVAAALSERARQGRRAGPRSPQMRSRAGSSPASSSCRACCGRSPARRRRVSPRRTASRRLSSRHSRRRSARIARSRLAAS